MPDVCNQDYIVVSKQLNLIFQKHFNAVYHLSWFDGFIRTYDGKHTVISKIKERYSDMIAKNSKLFAGDPLMMKGVEKFRRGVPEFINDFKALSHADIDILKSLKVLEGLGRKVGKGKYVIDRIDEKPIKVEV